MSAPAEFFLPFLKKEQIAKDTFAFYFDRSQVSFDFLPGQHIRMSLAITFPDDRGSSRFFTIASSSTHTNEIRIVTKVIQSVFKKTLLVLPVGKKVKFFGPIGMFYLRQDYIKQQVFLAGGIGITPFLSMLSYIDEKKLSLPVTLFVSFSTPEEVILQKEMEDIAKRNSSIHVVYTITHPEQATAWTGETGRITQDLIKKYVPFVSDALFYIVGPGAMVSAMEEVVSTMGVAKDQILKENFVGY